MYKIQLEKKVLFAFFLLVFSVSVTDSSFAQTKKKKVTKTPVKTEVKTEPQKTETTETVESAKIPAKKNERPGTNNNPVENSKSPESIVVSESEKNVARSGKGNRNKQVYFYEFSQPNFVTTHVFIEHDENGKGKISFRKKDLDEEFTDPVQFSPATMEKLKTHWNALNFLESKEEYQSKERDYPHLGKIKLGMGIDDYERFAEFNWTENKDAKALMDEYRKLANQYVWMFDITVARENQPLEAPRVIKTLESYLRRDEISDPQQMIPFLKQLSEDERIPLISRNNAARMIKDIEKKKKE